MLRNNSDYMKVRSVYTKKDSIGMHGDVASGRLLSKKQSDKAMRVLYVLKHNPWGRGGGCYACRGYLEALSEVFAGAAIDACVCAEYLVGARTELFPGVRFIPVEPRGRLQKMLTPLTQVLHRHQSTVVKLLSERQYDYVVFDHNAIAGSLAARCRKAGALTIVINHNCEVEYFGDNVHGVKRRVLLPVVRRNERRSYLECDVNIFLTAEDRDMFAGIYGQSQTKAIVGGCFLPRGTQMGSPEKRQSAATAGRRFTAIISGTIGNVQNMDGIDFFLDELYDALPPNVEVVITGQRPPKGFADRLKKYDRVTLVPNPDDILSVVREADIFICPTRTGGGMKLRVIDGLRCGLPVVAHDVSARGYSAFFDKDYFFRFTTEEEFAAAVGNLVRSYAAGDINRAAVIADARRAFSFAEAVSRLNQAIESK